MGNFSRDTFDKLKHYVSVRLQQGVPLVDADWNEQDDIRRYELQAFLKWFVGNGVPEGNDGFRIEAIAGSVNDFTIKGGDGTAEGAGRCIVEGWDVLIESSITYRGQPLHVSQPHAAELAAAWKVDTLPELSAPTDRTDLVYLDVWEREVDAGEDKNLVNSAIGLETCVRLRREWVVRVDEGAAVLPATPAGHIFYPLALVRRRAGQAGILPENISDRRLTGLKMASQSDMRQVVTDAYGSSYALDHDGQPNLKVSLRDAINALLRGELPCTPEQPLTTEAGYDGLQTALKDSNGDIWVFWASDRNNIDPFKLDIWCNRYSQTDAEWDGDIRLTTDATVLTLPTLFAFEDKTGDIWVFWSSYIIAKDRYQIWYKQYDHINREWREDARLTEDPENNYGQYVLEDNTENIWVFWSSDRNGDYEIWYNRYDYDNEKWEDHDTPLTEDNTPGSRPYALKDDAGDIWVFWDSYTYSNDYYQIWRKRYDHVLNEWKNHELLTIDTSNNYKPFALKDSTGDIWVFWISDRNGSKDIWYRRYYNDSKMWGPDTLLITEIIDFALVDRHGEIWVFWLSDRSGNINIWYKRYNRDVDDWRREKHLTTSIIKDENLPVALEDGHGDIWIFSTGVMVTNANNVADIWYRKLIPEI